VVFWVDCRQPLPWDYFSVARHSLEDSCFCVLISGDEISCGIDCPDLYCDVANS
jgi:hypothetical protein